jgi:DNA-directed RNA polymerase specialized sigma24 family protein
LIDSGIDIKEILKKTRSGKSGRDEVISMLYKDVSLRRKIESVVLKNGGQKTDFHTIFNNVLMQFVKTVIKNEDLEINSTLHAYLCGIAKYSWLNQLKKDIKHKSDNIEDQYDLSSGVTPETLLIDQGKITHLSSLLETLGKNCKEVLMYWANGYSMQEIAEMMDYKSDMMARKKKYKCFKELLELLEKNPDIKKVLR